MECLLRIVSQRCQPALCVLSFWLSVFFFCFFFPTGSPSRGGDVAVYVSDINQLSFPTPFYSVLVSVSVFMALSSVFHSIKSPNNSPLVLSRDITPSGCLGSKHQLTLTLFFKSYFCLIGPFNYISLYESLLQP